MTRRLQLSEEQARIVSDILTAHVPDRTIVRAFGSRAWGRPRTYSDLDLALKAEKRLDLAALAELSEAFSESDLPFKVDLSDWRALPPALRDAVDRYGFELTVAPAA